jgi:hypothetical protein
MSQNKNEVDFTDIVKQQEDRIKHQKAITTILRGIRYIMGYLPEMGFKILPDFKGNPIKLTLQVFWTDETTTWEILPTIVKEKIEKMEKEVEKISSGIGLMVGDAKIPKPVADDSTH